MALSARGKTVPAAGLARRRAPVMALAVVVLFAGPWGGLLRLGLLLAQVIPAAGEAHESLMALGSQGTLISLERVVALVRGWAYVAPLAAGAGALLALAGAPSAYGPALLTLAGFVLLAAHVALHHLQASMHNAVMGLGALAWSAAVILWLSGSDVARFAPLLAGFLVLTIVRERLELTRLTPRSDGVRRLIVGVIALFAAGLIVSIPAEAAGVRIAGTGLLVQTLWLARYDLAQRAVRVGASPGTWRWHWWPGMCGWAARACCGRRSRRSATARPMTPRCTRFSSDL